MAPEIIPKMWAGFDLATLSHYVYVDTTLYD